MPEYVILLSSYCSPYVTTLQQSLVQDLNYVVILFWTSLETRCNSNRLLQALKIEHYRTMDESRVWSFAGKVWAAGSRVWAQYTIRPLRSARPAVYRFGTAFREPHRVPFRTNCKTLIEPE